MELCCYYMCLIVLLIKKKATMSKKVKIEYRCLPHEYTKAKIAEIKQKMFDLNGIPVCDIEVEPKYIQKENTNKKLSKDVAQTLMDSSKLKESYKKYLIEKYDADEQLISDFLSLDDEISSQVTTGKESTLDRKYEVLWIEGKNIFSYGDFYRSYKDSGLNLIHSAPTEPNMGGKSSLTRLVPFLIFGDKMKRGHNSLPYKLAFNHYTKDDTAFIQGEIKIHNDFYFLRREMKRKKDGELKHTFTIYKYSENGDELINGKKAVNISKKDNKATLSIFQEVVGDYDDYVFASHYENHNVEKWIATKPTERYRLFCQYLGLGILEEKNQISAKMLTAHQKSSYTGKYSVDDIKSRLLELSSNKDNLDKDSAEILLKIDAVNLSNDFFIGKKAKLLSEKPQIDKRFVGKTEGDYNYDISKILQEIGNIEKNISNLKIKVCNISNINEYDSSKFAYLEESIKSNTVLIADLKSQLNNTPSNEIILSLENEISKLKTAINNISMPEYMVRGLEQLESVLGNTRAEFLNIQSQISSLSQEIKDLPAKIVCNNCGAQEDTSKRKQEMQDKLQSLKEYLKVLEENGLKHKNMVESERKNHENWKTTERSKIQKDIDANSLAIRKIQDEHKSQILWKIESTNAAINSSKEIILFNKEISNLENQLQFFKSKYESVSEEYKEFLEYVSQMKDTSEVDAQIASIEETIQKNNNILLELNIQRDKYSKEGGSIEREIEIQNNILAQLELDVKKERVLKIYTDVHGKDGLNKSIILSILPQINEDLMILLSEVSDFSLEIQFDDDKIEFIISRDGISKDISSASGFEATVSCLALHQVNVKRTNIPTPNILVLDEVMGRIGEANINGVMKMISKLKEVFPVVDLITHDHVDIIEDYCDGRILVEKNNNISKFVWTK